MGTLTGIRVSLVCAIFMIQSLRILADPIDSSTNVGETFAAPADLAHERTARHGSILHGFTWYLDSMRTLKNSARLAWPKVLLSRGPLVVLLLLGGLARTETTQDCRESESWNRRIPKFKVCQKVVDPKKNKWMVK